MTKVNKAVVNDEFVDPIIKMEYALSPFSQDGEEFWTGQFLYGLARGDVGSVINRLVSRCHNMGFEMGFDAGKLDAKVVRRPAIVRKTKTSDRKSGKTSIKRKAKSRK